MQASHIRMSSSQLTFWPASMHLSQAKTCTTPLPLQYLSQRSHTKLSLFILMFVLLSVIPPTTLCYTCLGIYSSFFIKMVRFVCCSNLGQGIVMAKIA